MKKIIFIIYFATLLNSSSAQKSYNITYESLLWYPAYNKFLPTINFRLLIKDSISYEYAYFERDDVKSPYGKKFRVHSSFKNISSNLFLSQSEPMGMPRYLISDTIPKIKWDLYEEEKSVLNYTCKKATCTYNNKSYLAWYTRDIPLSFGPGLFGGLPGLILELESTKSITTASSITKENVEIVKPDVGKKISRENFNNIKKQLHSSGRGIGYLLDMGYLIDIRVPGK